MNQYNACSSLVGRMKAREALIVSGTWKKRVTNNVILILYVLLLNLN